MICEEKKASFKHFLLVLSEALIIGLIGSAVRYFLPNLKLAGDLITIVLFCILAYLTLIHYTAVFEYKLDGYTLFVTRRIGARVKPLQIKTGSIVSLGRQNGIKADKTQNMCVSIFSKKHAVRVLYREGTATQALWIEPGSAFLEELASRIKQTEE